MVALMEFHVTARSSLLKMNEHMLRVVEPATLSGGLKSEPRKRAILSPLRKL